MRKNEKLEIKNGRGSTNEKIIKKGSLENIDRYIKNNLDNGKLIFELCYKAKAHCCSFLS